MEPTLPRSFAWLLQLFSFLLDVKPADLYDEVLRLERKVFSGKTPRGREPRPRSRGRSKSRSRASPAAPQNGENTKMWLFQQRCCCCHVDGNFYFVKITENITLFYRFFFCRNELLIIRMWVWCRFLPGHWNKIIFSAWSNESSFFWLAGWNKSTQICKWCLFFYKHLFLCFSDKTLRCCCHQRRIR